MFSYIDGRVTDVHGVVRVGGLHVELQNVVDEGRVDVQRAQTLHHPRLAAQHLKHTAGDTRVVVYRKRLCSYRTKRANDLHLEP